MFIVDFNRYVSKLRVPQLTAPMQGFVLSEFSKLRVPQLTHPKPCDYYSSISKLRVPQLTYIL